MDIEIIEMAERKAKFILKNSSPAMANALRRTLLSDIPKMAIDKVEFYLGTKEGDDGKEYESITPLFEEIIAHRLGMLPVPTNLDLFVPQNECTCNGEGCPNCTIIYSINKTGPATVYSSDLVPLSGGNSEELKIVDQFIPVVELTQNQGITAYAKAVMGTAKKHVKWQVANGVGYKYLPVIEIDPKKAKDEDVVACAASCPKKVFAVDKSGKLTVKDLYECSLCKACVDSLGGLEKAITVTGDSTNFYFKFETDGSLTAQQTLDKALEVLSKEATDFAGEIEEL